MTFANASEDLKELLSSNILGGFIISDDGGLDISWTKGAIFDGSDNQNISAGSATLTNNDTNYLKWVSGTTLTVALTTATGSEVLVATIVCSSGDIDSITDAGFVDVTGVTGRPTIKLESDDFVDVTIQNGNPAIIIGEENLIGFNNRGQFRDEIYRIMVDVKFDSTNSVALKNIIGKFDSLFTTNNKTGTREYFYSLSYGWQGNYLVGEVNLSVDAIREMVII